MLWLCKEFLRHQGYGADDAANELKFLIHSTTNTWKVSFDGGCSVVTDPRNRMLPGEPKYTIFAVGQHLAKHIDERHALRTDKVANLVATRIL
ncbi:hypothetical protein C1O66_04145 [Paucibacter aquatile]|uniref:Uncharacterized protein n=1 Tax=Kinneretia aquatilis TaxID=2070761 RepID=A0A2N8KTM2_9BURK|nr:hypothetical protein C1O66_04145 [Paucibacter aquatile]